ncbi:BcNRPS1, nonribosomal peptide synthetase [Xylaria intraflava]|nr:BcNRPS1, nonribosomal peptide synthetase [Xylaria intraflava]
MSSLSLDSPASVRNASVMSKAQTHTLSKNDNLVMQHISHVLEMAVEDLSLDASFIGQGGHSLLAIQLASRCRSSGINIAVGAIMLAQNLREILSIATASQATNSRVEVVEVVEVKALSASSTHSLDMKKSMIVETTVEVDSCSESESEDVAQEASLTEMQMSFVHSFMNKPGTNVINFYETYQTKNIPSVRAAWKRVIEAEPIFKLSFADADTGKIVELSQAPFKWVETVVDSRAEYESVLAQDISPQTMEVSFEVITLPSEGISTVAWRVHHAFIDGMAAQLVYNKFQGALAGKDVIPGTPFQTVIRDIRDYQRETLANRKEFWAAQAAKHPQPVCDIGLGAAPTDGPEGMDSVSITVPYDSLNAKARALGVSVPSWFQAAWALVLSLYADSDSVAFGTILSGRDLPVNGVADTIGPLINTLPFNVTLDHKANVADYLRAIFRHSFELSNVQCSVPDDGFTRQFTTAVAMEFEMAPAADQGIQPIGPSSFRTTPDIPLSIYTTYNGEIRLCFQKNKYFREDMQVLAEHFHDAIMRLCSWTCTVGDVMASLLTTSSKDTLMKFGNCLSEKTSPAFIKEDLVTLFEKSARENPTALAVEKSGKALSYAEFDLLASRIATRLVSEYGVAPGDVVCVHADRSINWIVAIFAILKAGAVYSAQDAALPAQIRDTNFQTAGAKLFVTPSAAQKHIKPDSCEQCLSVEELISATGVTAMEHRATPRPSDSAYLCFTSGSTGKPKGVMCHHSGLVAFQITPEVRFFARPGQRLSQLMSPAFDGSIHEIFSALSYGATLVLADEDGDPFAHLKKVNASILTPSIAKILEPSEYPNLTTVYCVGEPMPQYVNDSWSANSNRGLYNMYGPTEATCGATIQRLLPGRKVTIGKPNTTTRIYVLDRNQRLLPPGVVGEIYCAGVQVARGYIGRPELTAERFLPDTICGRENEMMYRTGDRGFLNSRGEVECLGRNDRQIKLRGYRLDLNDLEIRIAQSVEGVTAVAICPNGDYLVCMVQPETLDVATVRATARTCMPVHAVPRYIVPVAKFPMTPAGKVDYKEIAKKCSAKPEETQTTKDQPMTPSQVALAQVWRETLGVQADVEINGASNFMALGGHSVMQLQLSSKLAKIHQISNPLPLIIRSATLAELAAAIDGRKAGQAATAAPSKDVVPLGNHRASPIEHDWFLKYELNFKGTSSFNVSYACAIDPAKVDTERLVGAWNVVLARHRIFRSRFIPCLEAHGGLHRLVARYAPQVTRVAPGKKFSIWREVNRPFRLDCDEHLIRVLVSKTKMLVVVSHILADLTTLQTVLKELTSVYNGEGLDPVNRTYEQTLQWSQPISSAQKDWWKTNLAGISQDYGIPHPIRLERTSYGGKTRYTKLSDKLSSRLLQFTDEKKITLHQLALASVAMAMQLHRNDTDIVLGAPYLNREAEDMETVGLFLEPLPIRIKFDQGSARDGSKFMSAVQQASQEAVSRAIPWHQILKATGADQDKTRLYPNHPLLDIMVTFHDHRSNAKNKWMSIEGLEPMLTQTKGSKFLLLTEFSAVGDGVFLLRTEYDNECIPNREIARIEQLTLEAMSMIMDGRGYAETKQALRSLPYLPAANFNGRNESTSRRNESSSRRAESTSRRNESYSRRNESYSGRNESYARRNESYAGRNESYSGRNRSYSRRNESASRRNESSSFFGKTIASLAEL